MTAYGVCNTKALRCKGYSDFVQHTSPMASGQLRFSFSPAQTLPISFGYSQAWHNSFRVEAADTFPISNRKKTNPLMWLDCAELEQLANSLIFSKSTSGGSSHNSLIFSKTCTAVSRETKHGRSPSLRVPNKSVATCALCTQEKGKHSFPVNQQVTGKEKGTAANGALWDDCFFNHEENQYSPDLGDGANLRHDDQPFGLMPRTINSRRANSFIQFAKLTPSRSASVSNCVLSSGLIRMWNGGDFPAPLGWLSLTVTSFSIDMCTPIDLSLFSLGVHTNMCVPKKTTPPNGITSTERGLTTNDNQRIEVAMLNHITPLTGRNSLPPNKYTWRFLAISRIDREAKPCRLSVEAHTEHEARKVLAPHFILSFAARLPVKGIGEINIPSTIAKTSTVQEVCHA